MPPTNENQDGTVKASLPDLPGGKQGELSRIIQTLISPIPFGIGSAINIQVFDRMAARQRELLEAFVRTLGERITQLETAQPGFLKREHLDTDEFRFILREVLTRATREHREEKIEAYQAALIDGMVHDPREDFDRKAFFLDTIDSLTTDHLRILRWCYGIAVPKTGLGDTRAATGLGRINAENACKFCRVTNPTDKAYVRAGLALLAARHLLTQGPGRVTRGSGRPGASEYPKPYRIAPGDEYWLSPLGEAFVEFFDTTAAEHRRAPKEGRKRKVFRPTQARDGRRRPRG